MADNETSEYDTVVQDVVARFDARLTGGDPNYKPCVRRTLTFISRRTATARRPLTALTRRALARRRKVKPPPKPKGRKGGSRHSKKQQEAAAAAEDEDDEEEALTEVMRLEEQPKCIKGGRMREYQLEGLNWLLEMHGRQHNGILADEMGLGACAAVLSRLAAARLSLSL